MSKHKYLSKQALAFLLALIMAAGIMLPATYAASYEYADPEYIYDYYDDYEYFDDSYYYPDDTDFDYPYDYPDYSDDFQYEVLEISLLTISESGGSFDQQLANGSLPSEFGLAFANRNDSRSSTNRNLNLVLSPGRDESEMKFSWFMNSSQGGIAIVERDNADTFEVFPSTSTPMSGRARADNRYRHTVTINNLSPSTIYNYVLFYGESINYETGTVSAPKTFATGDPSAFSFFVIGDIQIGRPNTISSEIGWSRAINAARNNHPYASFLISPGDQVETASNQAHYNGLLSPRELSGLPFAPAVGNHDTGNERFTRHFNLPNRTFTRTGVSHPDTSTSSDFDYWFRYGNALFIVLNSNELRMPAEREMLIESIVEENSDATWRFVTFHHAPYSEYRSLSYTAKQRVIENWIPIFERLDIDVVFTGHDHVGMRSFQMIGNAPQRGQFWETSPGVYRFEDAYVGSTTHNTVINPSGILYYCFNSGSGAGGASNRRIAHQHPFTAMRDQNGLANYSIVTLTDNSFTLYTYGVFNTGEVYRVDSYTIIKDDSLPARRMNISSFGDWYYYYGRTSSEFFYEAFCMDSLQGWTLAQTSIGYGDQPSSSGAGNLYGLPDRSPTTVITSGNGPHQRGSTRRHTTTYLKRTFELPTCPAEFAVFKDSIVDVSGTHRVDESLIIYINGQEVYRFNTRQTIDSTVAFGVPLAWNQYMGRGTDAINRRFDINDDYDLRLAYRTTNLFESASRTALLDALTPGENIITAVVGQNSSSATRLFFDLQLDIAFSPGMSTVAFDSNGGSTVRRIIIEQGTTITEPEAPTHPDLYRFIGWTLDGQLFDFSTTLITSSITLVANWEPAVQGLISVSAFGDFYYFYGRTSPHFFYDAFDINAREGWTRAQTAIGFGSSGTGLPSAPRTVIPNGTAPHQNGGSSSRHTTTYFRKTFDLPECPVEFESLVSTIVDISGIHRIDDALFIFINGQEVYRFNTRQTNNDSIRIGAQINWGMYMGENIDATNRSFNINSDYHLLRSADGTRLNSASRTNMVEALQPGVNVITAVVGQRDRTSSDLWFDLQLDITYLIF